MKKSPENKTVFTELGLLYEEFIDSLRDTQATTKEKLLAFLLSPIMIPVTIFGVLLGADRETSFVAGAFIAILSWVALAIYLLAIYGPFLIQQLNSYVNG